MEANQSIDRRRLDVVLTEISRTTQDPVTRAQVEGFEALIRTRHKDWRRSAQTVGEEIADFVMPRIGNWSILGSPHYVEILTDVVDRVLPSFGESDEITEIATAVVEEEIQRHRELRDRIHQALGS